MFTANLDKLGRTILMVALLALTLGAAACVGVDRGSDEAYTDSAAALASEVTAQDPGHGDPEAPCCSSCGSVCNLYGSDSLECESCRSSCRRCSLAASETMAQDPGHGDPEAPCCSSCGSVCNLYGSDSLECESCRSSCRRCSLAGSTTIAQDPGDVDPEAPCCEGCGTLCRRYGPDSYQCEACWSACDFCNGASADCEPAAAPAN